MTSLIWTGKIHFFYLVSTTSQAMSKISNTKLYRVAAKATAAIYEYLCE